jgi:hypothetical protein
VQANGAKKHDPAERRGSAAEAALSIHRLLSAANEREKNRDNGESQKNVNVAVQGGGRADTENPEA